ncbi:hypothetical protein BD779DRAFT_599171 [Infundibulicybe gibba]|nr:hypothetical protein BD779DRAFT_599171 [Infundibulicybe gibba]
MVLLFDQLFSCCIRKHPRLHPNLDVPDEQSRLIIAATELPSPISSSNDSLTNDQKLRDRFDTIVRAKEGKMVNVAAQIPFNLHNKPLLGVSSRSTSMSASHRPTRKHRPPMLSAFEDITPVPSNPSSPSRRRSHSHSSSMSLRYNNDCTMDKEFTNDIGWAINYRKGPRTEETT